MFIDQLRATDHGWTTLVVDRDYRIISASNPRSVGSSVLEKPGVRDAYHAHCERAWETGEPFAFRCFCVGRVWENHLALSGGGLSCASKIVFALELNDLVTADRLFAAVTLASEALAAPCGPSPYAQAHDAPRPARPGSVLALVRIDAPPPADAAIRPASHRPA